MKYYFLHKNGQYSNHADYVEKPTPTTGAQLMQGDPLPDAKPYTPVNLEDAIHGCFTRLAPHEQMDFIQLPLVYKLIQSNHLTQAKQLLQTMVVRQSAFYLHQEMIRLFN